MGSGTGPPAPSGSSPGESRPDSGRAVMAEGGPERSGSAVERSRGAVGGGADSSVDHRPAGRAGWERGSRALPALGLRPHRPPPRLLWPFLAGPVGRSGPPPDIAPTRVSGLVALQPVYSSLSPGLTLAVPEAASTVSNRRSDDGGPRGRAGRRRAVERWPEAWTQVPGDSEVCGRPAVCRWPRARCRMRRWGWSLGGQASEGAQHGNGSPRPPESWETAPGVGLAWDSGKVAEIRGRGLSSPTCPRDRWGWPLLGTSGREAAAGMRSAGCPGFPQGQPHVLPRKSWPRPAFPASSQSRAGGRGGRGGAESSALGSRHEPAPTPASVGPVC